MTNLLQQLPHMLIAALAIAAATVLACLGEITGATAIGVIGVAGGASFGVAASNSSSTTSAAPVTPAAAPVTPAPTVPPGA